MEKVELKNAKELKEVYEILKFFPENELSKIPKKFLNFIDENKDNEYEFEWSEEKELDENTVLPGTITLMQMIFLTYYASDEEKAEINRVLDENEKRFQQEVYEKYNPNAIFKKSNKIIKDDDITENNNDNQMIVYKENIFKKILNSILNIFRRRK